MTQVPGANVKHTVITEESRTIHGDGGAFNKAAIALLSEYNAITRQKGDEKGINYHLVLTVEKTEGLHLPGCDERIGQRAYSRPLHKDPSKTPTEKLPAVKDPAPHLTQAEKDAGCDGK